jgi:hypothetical protein
MEDSKESSGKGYILAGSLLFLAVAIAICGFFYRIVELTCSRIDDTCTIVRTAPLLGESHMSFRLSSLTSAEKTVFTTSFGGSRSSGAWHIALHTMDGDRHLTGYDTAIGVEKMDKNVIKIKDFIVDKISQTLVVRQDDRIIALASLPFLIFSILLLLLWYWIGKQSEVYPATTA